MSPIPKESRLYKFKEGKIQPDEKFEERFKMVSDFVVDGEFIFVNSLDLKNLCRSTEIIL